MLEACPRVHSSSGPGLVVHWIPLRTSWRRPLCGVRLFVAADAGKDSNDALVEGVLAGEAPVPVRRRPPARRSSEFCSEVSPVVTLVKGELAEIAAPPVRRAHGRQGEDNSAFALVDREVSDSSEHDVAEAW